MVLKPYKAEKEQKLNQSAPISTGIACPEMICGPCGVHHRAQERPVKEPRQEREQWARQHRHKAHCKGEMMWTEPHQKHPELTELARAICNTCGWKGWC